jgi:hypothetical protein
MDQALAKASKLCPMAATYGIFYDLPSALLVRAEEIVDPPSTDEVPSSAVKNEAFGLALEDRGGSARRAPSEPGLCPTAPDEKESSSGAAEEFFIPLFGRGTEARSIQPRRR